LTWDEILAVLAKAENGAAAVEALKKIDTENRNALMKAKTDAKKAKDTLKESDTKLTAAQERAEKVLEAIGVDSDADDGDLDEAIQTALKSKSADPALTKRIAKLEKKMSEQDASYKSQLSEERGKRYDGMKHTALMEALVKNNADDPNLILDMLIGKMTVNEDDESIVFNDDKTPEIDGYVKSFLEAHPKLVKDTQNPGAGSLHAGGQGSSGGGNDPDVAFVEKLASNGAKSEGDAKALAGYFS
jgi:hypothetical protein